MPPQFLGSRQTRRVIDVHLTTTQPPELARDADDSAAAAARRHNNPGKEARCRNGSEINYRGERDSALKAAATFGVKKQGRLRCDGNIVVPGSHFCTTTSL